METQFFLSDRSTLENDRIYFRTTSIYFGHSLCIDEPWTKGEIWRKQKRYSLSEPAVRTLTRADEKQRVFWGLDLFSPFSFLWWQSCPLLPHPCNKQVAPGLLYQFANFHLNHILISSALVDTEDFYKASEKIRSLGEGRGDAFAIFET